MRIRSRLTFLLASLLILVGIGRVVTGDFAFLLTQFWFTAGFFLLLLLSLIDQPHFSKDANIFVNATTAWVSLLLVNSIDRDAIWWSFFGWASYLITSSYILMWARSRELQDEKYVVQVVSRVNRQIGRPEAIFSAFFIWGCVHQFGGSSPKLSPLFLFWAVFMILNLPALSAAIDSLLTPSVKDERQRAGVLLSVTSPRIAEASLAPELPVDVVGRLVSMRNKDDKPVATGVLVDDRMVLEDESGALQSQRWRRAGQVLAHRRWSGHAGFDHGYK